MKRKISLGLAAVFVLLVAPTMVGAAGPVTPDAAGAQAAVVLPASTAHGGGFQVQSMLDQSFCIEVAAGATDLRPVTLGQCSALGAQRWTFSWLASGLNQMIETQGMCVDVSSRKPGDGLAVPVTFCKDTRPEKLTFTMTGQIEFARGCLAVPRAGAGAAVFIEKCDDTKPNQHWKLSQ
ncbi:MAG: ricin-type beta-trefoil lectin domain protein [Chloroflexota bacterium]